MKEKIKKEVLNSYYTCWRNKKPSTKVTKVSVYEDGTIKVGSQVLHQHGTVGDSDLDAFVNVNAYVEIPNKYGKDKRDTVDNIMAAAGFVQGDKTKFHYPVVLHKDYDRMNCSSSNLEWCDMNDPRYKEYHSSWETTLEQLKAEKDKLYGRG